MPFTRPARRVEPVWRHATALAAAMVVVSLGVSAPARACSYAPPPPRAPQPATLDPGELVSRVSIDKVTIHRGLATSPCRTSCDDLGLITIVLTMPDSGRHSVCDFDFLLELASGAPPAGLPLTTAITGATCMPGRTAASISFTWIEEERNDQDPFAFDLRITPRDATAKTGPPTVVRVQHDGKPAPVDPQRCSQGAPTASAQDPSGCVVGGRRQPSASGGLLLLVAAVGLVARRRGPGSICRSRRLAEAQQTVVLPPTGP
jgi:hypothetical protein